jgi:hypothetical protein
LGISLVVINAENSDFIAMSFTPFDPGMSPGVSSAEEITDAYYRLQFSMVVGFHIATQAGASYKISDNTPALAII